MKFEVFKIGTHTSDKGITKDYTLDDLNFIAKSYNPQEDEAPIVVGHPVDNSPAYGWVSSLEVTPDGKLVADVPDEKLQSDFLTAVKEGRYKKRSISLTPDGKLRHIGFLGGAAPAVKGLADIQFSQPSSTIIEFDLEVTNENPDNHSSADNNNSDNPGSDNLSLDSISAKIDELSKSLSDLNQSFTENKTDELKTKIDSLQSQFVDLQSKINRDDFNSLLDEKLSQGYLTPVIKDKILSFSNFMESQNFSNDFSQDKFTKEVRALLKELIGSFPKIVHFENFAEKPEHDDKSIDDDFSGFTVDQESKALHKKALNLMKKDNISYLAAVKSLITK